MDPMDEPLDIVILKSGLGRRAVTVQAQGQAADSIFDGVGACSTLVGKGARSGPWPLTFRSGGQCTLMGHVCSILVGCERSEGAMLGRSKAPDALRWGMLDCGRPHVPTVAHALSHAFEWTAVGARGEGAILWAGGQCTFPRG